MIPADVDITGLSQQIEADHVAIAGDLDPSGALNQELVDVVNQLQGSDFGSLGVVLLDRVPAVEADMRDIAWQIQQNTGLETIILRGPYSGAVVSDVYNRAEIEAAQHDLLGNPDVPASIANFGMDVMNNSYPWPMITLILAAIILFLAAATFIAVGRNAKRQ